MENIENEIKWLEEIDLESEMKGIRKNERRKIRTAVMIGRSGNGKSATGNSILGRRAFASKYSTAGVTNTCKLQSTELEDGKIINIIDTPGMFDFSDPATIAKEIGKSVVLARHGIHAVVLVLSIQSCFTREEACAVENLKELFGSEVHHYTIIIFTGGDALEDQGITLNDYLGSLCPQPLKDWGCKKKRKSEGLVEKGGRKGKKSSTSQTGKLGRIKSGELIRNKENDGVSIMGALTEDAGDCISHVAEHPTAGMLAPVSGD